MEIVGTVSSISPVQKLAWTIDNFYNLLESNRKISSPQFSFAFTEWKICILPIAASIERGIMQYRSNFEMSLQRGKDNVLPPAVEYKFEIRNCDGTASKTFCGDKDFTSRWSQNGHKFNLRQVMNEIMNTPRNVFGCKGQLTIVCHLRRKNMSGVAASTQTEEESLVQMKNSEEASTQTEQYIPSAEKLIQDFAGLLGCKEGSDVTFRVHEKEFKAHRLLLDARSPVFSGMFRHEMVESSTGVVTIEDCEPDTFEDFLHYVYTGALRVRTLDRALILHGLGEKYQMEELKAECSELMRDLLSVDTFCDVMTVAVRHRDEKLTDLATVYFLEYMGEIVFTPAWQDFVVHNPIEANELFMRSVMEGKTKTPKDKAACHS